MKGTVADPSKPYDSWTGGRLNPAYYDDYAEYFVQWVTEMEENGFPIYAITMQNEPLNKGNSMSLYMPWEDQLAFVKKLGPAFRKAGIDIQDSLLRPQLQLRQRRPASRTTRSTSTPTPMLRSGSMARPGTTTGAA